MRLDTGDIVASESDQRQFEEKPSRPNQLTPARRAALDALEREFRDLLQARPLAASG